MPANSRKTLSNIAGLFPTITPSPAAAHAGRVRYGVRGKEKALMSGAQPPANNLSRLIFLAAVAACAVAATAAWLSLGKVRKRRIP